MTHSQSQRWPRVVCAGPSAGDPPAESTLPLTSPGAAAAACGGSHHTFLQRHGCRTEAGNDVKKCGSKVLCWLHSGCVKVATIQRFNPKIWICGCRNIPGCRSSHRELLPDTTSPPSCRTVPYVEPLVPSTSDWHKTKNTNWSKRETAVYSCLSLRDQREMMISIMISARYAVLLLFNLNSLRPY